MSLNAACRKKIVSNDQMKHKNIVRLTFSAFIALFTIFGNSSSAQGYAFGVHATELLNLPLPTFDRVAKMLDSANVRWVRINLAWMDAEPTKGQWNWGDWETRLQILRSHNLEILCILMKVPSWASSAPTGTDPLLVSYYVPKDTRDWIVYVDSVANKFKGYITHWEIWNEPDLLGFWAGTPAQYAELLAVTYETIKRANPQAKVVLGGLALDERRVHPNFLSEILSDARYPAARYFDIMNFHHYGSRDEARRRIDEVRTALRQAGALSKPTWITETGYSSDPSQQNDPNYQGLEGQAQWLRDMIPYLLQLGAEKVFWYRLYDYPADFTQDVGARYHGPIDDQGNPKPDYFADREIVKADTIVIKSVEDTLSLYANPSMGWQTFHRAADRDGNLAGLPTTMVYRRFAWLELEPENRRFDFSLFDQWLEWAKHNGQRLAWRLMVAGSERTSPSTPLLGYAPLWLKDMGVSGYIYYFDGNENNQQDPDEPDLWVPDLADSVARFYHDRLVAELGKRYGGHPYLDLLDIGSVGLWGGVAFLAGNHQAGHW
ncbi:MAG: glycosyl hydrolase [candidate division KSB1 bacterium]|nr:glycosyl hydrolase [candidate division KSB1 bacterium]MDZ7368268.1 glycosyl hydrolase [candidate division KSB1 bacterium]MDZ7406152.1 glycosyl hydrolase [candidate division KSB1 bacterium]